MSLASAALELDGERVWLVTDGSTEEAALVLRAAWLKAQGLSLRAIGRAIGRSHTWVHQALNTHAGNRGGRSTPLTAGGRF